MSEIVSAIIMFAISVMFASLWFIMIRYDRGFREGRTNTATGQLTHFQHDKNVHIRKWEEKTHKRTSATYTYVVDGVMYEKHCIVIDRYKPMPASTKVVYQKKHPEQAFLPEFEIHHEHSYVILLIFSIAFFCMGVEMFLS